VTLVPSCRRCSGNLLTEGKTGPSQTLGPFLPALVPRNLLTEGWLGLGRQDPAVGRSTIDISVDTITDPGSKILTADQAVRVGHLGRQNHGRIGEAHQHAQVRQANPNLVGSVKKTALAQKRWSGTRRPMWSGGARS